MRLNIDRGGFKFRFELVEHPMDQEPTSPAQHIGYVRFPGSSVMKVAHWKRGQWLDYKSRPFDHTPEAWYSVELPNG